MKGKLVISSSQVVKEDARPLPQPGEFYRVNAPRRDDRYRCPKCNGYLGTDIHEHNGEIVRILPVLQSFTMHANEPGACGTTYPRIAGTVNVSNATASGATIPFTWLEGPLDPTEGRRLMRITDGT